MLFTAKLPESPTFSCLTHRTPRHGSTSQVNHLSHNPLIYVRAFMPLALASCLDREVLITLFGLGITYHQPMELPDTTNLDWKEVVIRGLESLRSRAGIPLAALLSSPPLLGLFFSKIALGRENTSLCVLFSLFNPPTPETVLRHQE